MVILPFLCTSCAEVYDSAWTSSPDKRSLFLSHSELQFSDAGQTKTVDVRGSGIPWQFQNNASWLSFLPSSGSSAASVSVCALANTSDTARTAYSQLVSTDDATPRRLPLTVTQSAPEPVISFSPSDVTLNGAGAQAIVHVDCNRTWSFTKADSWLTVSRSSDNLILSATPNDGADDRETYVNVSAGLLTKSLHVIQKPAGIATDAERLEFSNAEGSQSFTFTSDAEWTSQCSQSWIDVQPQYGSSGTFTLTVSVQANTASQERKGNIYLYIGNVRKRAIEVVQSGSQLSVSPTELDFGSGSASQTLTISGNSSWRLDVSDASWLHLDKTSGTGNASVRVSVDANTGNQRSNTITLYNAQSGAVVQTVSVVQQPAGLSVTPSQLAFPAEGDTKSLYVNTPSAWTATVSDSWVKLDTSEGVGPKTVQVTVQPNDNAYERTASITVSTGTLSRTITVTQGWNSVVQVDPTYLVFPVSGSSRQIAITANVGWSLSTTASWITLSRQSGQGNATVTVTASANKSSAERSASIYLRNASGATVATITATQSVSELSGSLSRSTFPYTGGEASLTISSNDGWRLSAPSWVTLSSDNGNGDATVRVTVSRNADYSSRDGHIVLSNLGNTVSIPMAISQEGAPQPQEYERNLGYTFPSSGASLNVSSFEAESWVAEVLEGASWISLSPTSGSSGQTLYVTTQDNPSGQSRTGRIKVTYGYHSYLCPVVQAGKTLQLSTSSVGFFAKGGTSSSIVATADKAPTLSTDASWLTIKQDGKVFTLVATQNTSSQARQATVTVTLSGVTDAPKATVSVRQAGVQADLPIEDFDDDKNWN